MIGIAIFCWCIAAALTVRTTRQLLYRCWLWCREHYRIIWLVSYAAYFIWCVWYEHKTGKAGGELFALVIIPCLLYFWETRKEGNDENDKAEK